MSASTRSGARSFGTKGLRSALTLLPSHDALNSRCPVALTPTTLSPAASIWIAVRSVTSRAPYAAWITCDALRGVSAPGGASGGGPAGELAALAGAGAAVGDA